MVMIVWMQKKKGGNKHFKWSYVMCVMNSIPQYVKVLTQRTKTVCLSKSSAISPLFRTVLPGTADLHRSSHKKRWGVSREEMDAYQRTHTSHPTLSTISEQKYNSIPALLKSHPWPKAHTASKAILASASASISLITAKWVSEKNSVASVPSGPAGEFSKSRAAGSVSSS